MSSLLTMQGITKRYPGVLALNHVDFSLSGGEVHALVGENGAGKSTLMKILSGAVRKDEGTISVDNNPVDIDSPITAQRLGIGIIYQDFKLVPELSVAENIFLGNEPRRRNLPFIDFAGMNQAARSILSQLGEETNPAAPVSTLSVAQRQVVEIAKTLSRRVRILAMDEPTASLTDREIENLFSVISRLQSDGVGVIYISHRLEEIFDIADRVTVLRDGNVINTCPMSEADRTRLIQWMVGRELADEYPRVKMERGTEILRIEGVSTRKLKDVSLSLYRGEILGLAGLVGAGRTELARAVFAADPMLTGTIVLNGTEIHPSTPKEAIEAGIGLLTEDRNLQGLILPMNVRENVSLSNLSETSRGPFIDMSKERSVAGSFIQQLQIKAPSTETQVEGLSGGNRQKVVLARWLFTRSKVLIFDEPTVGIDVGVKYEIYNLINRLAKDGIGVIVISSDMQELLGICHRIAVMCDGRITGILTHKEATQEKILKLATSFALPPVRQTA